LGSEEFNLVKEKLSEKLSVTFRVNQGFFNYEKIIEIFKDKHFISHNLIKDESNSKKACVKIKDLMQQSAPHSFQV